MATKKKIILVLKKKKITAALKSPWKQKLWSFKPSEIVNISAFSASVLPPTESLCCHDFEIQVVNECNFLPRNLVQKGHLFYFLYNIMGLAGSISAK